jgi:uncharacterized protein HemY
MAECDFALELDSQYSTTLCYLAEVATRLGDEARCEKLYKLLLPYRDLTITADVTTVCIGVADRYLGLLASALGDWEIAEAHFRDAIALEERMRAGPWLAHTQHELADMLERHGIGGDIEIADLREKVLEAASQFGMKALHDKYRRYLQ